MKKMVLAVAVTAMTGAALCAEGETAPLLAKQTEKDPAKPSVLQRVGGFVIDYKAARGKYAFVNCQSKVDAGILKGLVAKMRDDYAWNFEAAAGATDVNSLKRALEDKRRIGALAATYIVDCEELPMLSVVPEANLAVVNVRELAAGNPKPILMENRLVRETLRAFAFSLGTGYTTFETGVMQPIATAADIDRFPSSNMPPDVANAALQNGARIGFKPYRRTTYKRACREGWAPAPTNEVQQAIWDEIHTLPKGPIKIEFDPKKGK